MQIKFNQEVWKVERMPKYWILEKPETGTSISFYGDYSVEELKKRLSNIEKNIENLVEGGRKINVINKQGKR